MRFARVALAAVDGMVWVDEENCMGCGVCVNKCAREALSLRLAPEKGVPFEMEKLMAQAALRGENNGIMFK